MKEAAIAIAAAEPSKSRLVSISPSVSTLPGQDGEPLVVRKQSDYGKVILPFTVLCRLDAY